MGRRNENVLLELLNLAGFDCLRLEPDRLSLSKEPKIFFFEVDTAAPDCEDLEVEALEEEALEVEGSTRIAPRASNRSWF